jgi:hypothetical protein
MSDNITPRMLRLRWRVVTQRRMSTLRRKVILLTSHQAASLHDLRGSSWQSTLDKPSRGRKQGRFISFPTFLLDTSYIHSFPSHSMKQEFNARDW